MKINYDYLIKEDKKHIRIDIFKNRRSNNINAISNGNGC